MKPGDRCDLESDIFADHCGGAIDSAAMGDTEHPEFQFEFETVQAIEIESADCIRVDFESGFSCGFPSDHWLDVDAEQIRQ
ncbi:hypothetical protein NKJ28_00265 [Mesorhizobium sp. M0145]|uniref:hypothetical protein n=1 Tax=Mesorhizobium sp. M0145 TaxID=2956895 RepID=UPI0033379D64